MAETGTPVAAETGPLPFALTGVAKTFGVNRVFDDLNFAVPPGAVVGLLGANGSGKSTLIQLLVGLLRPDTGRVSIGSHDVWHLPDAIKARMGYVEQRPALYPWMRGRDLLAYLGSFYPRWDTALIDRLAAEWEVDLATRFGKLSPGHQQKVALLAAVANHPDLLILDEPVSALDPAARRAFLRSLMELVTDRGTTVLFSTHITSDLERVASHLALLDDRYIVCFEELDALKDRTKRLRVRTPTPFPPGFQPSGAARCSVDGDTAVVLVTGDPAAVATDLRTRLNAEVSVEDLNLEEIYLELTAAGGPRV